MNPASEANKPNFPSLTEEGVEILARHEQLSPELLDRSATVDQPSQPKQLSLQDANFQIKPPSQMLGCPVQLTAGTA